MKFPCGQQNLSARDARFVVYRKNLNRGPADSGAADEHRSVPAEIRIPIIGSRVEQTSQFAAFGIQAGDVRTLV